MAYWRQFCKRLGRDFFAATVEQVIGVLLAIGIASFQFKYGIIHASEVHANLWAIAWPYVFLVGALFLWHLVRTPYLLDREKTLGMEAERQRTQAIKEQLAAQEDAQQNSVSSGDWMTLAKKFGEPSQIPRRVQYQSTRAETTWYLNDARYSALCMRAGTMLLKSRHVRDSLPESIRTIPEPVTRWLNLIKELNRAQYDSYGVEELADGSKLIHNLGCITDLGAVSANLCIECSAREV